MTCKIGKAVYEIEDALYFDYFDSKNPEYDNDMYYEYCGKIENTHKCLLRIDFIIYEGEKKGTPSKLIDLTAQLQIIER